MPSVDLYIDSALTTLAAMPLTFAQDTAGATPPHQRVFYFVSKDTGLTFYAQSAPTVDLITISIEDASPGSGQPASAIKLATTQGGLASATGGAALEIGASFDSGVENAVTIWVQFDDTTATAATDTAISLICSDLAYVEPTP
jgi:hypothetical protein